MILASTTTALGVFDHKEEAAKAVAALKEAGFADDQIGVASREWAKTFSGVDNEEQKAAEKGAITGSLVGGSLGAMFGIIGAAVAPEVIPIMAGSALVSGLIGAAAGAAGGAFAGPFIALGLSEADAARHSRQVDEGKTVLLVYSPDRMEEARKTMVDYGAFDESMSSSP